jgi:hypothetical protein
LSSSSCYAVFGAHQEGLSWDHICTFRKLFTQCLVNSRKYTSRWNPSIGKLPLVFNSSMCIAIAKSIHKMHVAIFHVGKHKRHFSNSMQLNYHPFSRKMQTVLPYQPEGMQFRDGVSCNTIPHCRTGMHYTVSWQVQCMEPQRRPHFSLAIISITVQLWI